MKDSHISVGHPQSRCQKQHTTAITHYNPFEMNLLVLSAKSKSLVLYCPLSAKIREIVNGLTVARG